jgi:hypothetical protein
MDNVLEGDFAAIASALEEALQLEEETMLKTLRSDTHIPRERLRARRNALMVAAVVERLELSEDEREQAGFLVEKAERLDEQKAHGQDVAVQMVFNFLIARELQLERKSQRRWRSLILGIVVLFSAVVVLFSILVAITLRMVL